jgi:hypothetical protein
LVLNAEQVAAAVASGCVFEPASPAAVQRLAMQRKVFYIDGQAVLAGRGDGLFETVGTLLQLIEQGRQVLAYHQVPVAAAPAVAAPALAPTEAPEAVQQIQPEPIVAEAAPASPAQDDATPEDAPVASLAATPEAPAEAPAAAEPASAAPAIAPAPVAARTRAVRRRTPPVPASSVRAGDEPIEASPATEPDAPDAAAAPATAAADQPRMPARRPSHAKPRWVTAGAERRGRRENHWTGHQK